jgi:hypothetical protein
MNPISVAPIIIFTRSGEFSKIREQKKRTNGSMILKISLYWDPHKKLQRTYPQNKKIEKFIKSSFILLILNITGKMIKYENTTEKYSKIFNPNSLYCAKTSVIGLNSMNTTRM